MFQSLPGSTTAKKKPVQEQRFNSTLKSSPKQKITTSSSQLSLAGNKSKSTSQERFSSRLRSPKQSSHIIDETILLRSQVKDLSEQLEKSINRRNELQDQMQCLKDLTDFLRQTAETHKAEEYDAKSRLWDVKSELTQKQVTIDTLTQQIKTQQSRIDELEQAKRKEPVNRVSSLDSDAKRLQAQVKTLTKELNDCQKRLLLREQSVVMNKELKEKLSVVWEVNDLLREQLKRTTNNSTPSQRRESQYQSIQSPNSQSPDSEVSLLRQKVQLLEKNEAHLEKLMKERQMESQQREKTLQDKLTKIETQGVQGQDSEHLKNQVTKLSAQVTQQFDKITALTAQLQKMAVRKQNGSKETSLNETTFLQEPPTQIKKQEPPLPSLMKQASHRKVECETDEQRTPQRQGKNEELTKLAHQVTRQQEIIAQKKTEIKNLEAQLRQKEQKEQELQKHVNKIQQTTKDLAQKLDVQEKRYQQQLQQEKDAIEQQCISLHAKINDLLQSLNEANRRETLLQETVKLLDDQVNNKPIDKLKLSEVQKPESQKNDVAASLPARDEVTQLKTQMEHQMKEYDDAVSKLKEKDAQLSKLQMETDERILKQKEMYEDRCTQLSKEIFEKDQALQSLLSREPNKDKVEQQAPVAKKKMLQKSKTTVTQERNILLSSSEDEEVDEDKFKDEINYYKQEFENLLLVSQEKDLKIEQIIKNHQKQVKDCEDRLQREIEVQQALSQQLEDRDQLLKTLKNREELLEKEITRLNQFAYQQPSPSSRNSIVNAEDEIKKENEDLRRRLQVTEGNLQELQCQIEKKDGLLTKMQDQMKFLSTVLRKSQPEGDDDVDQRLFHVQTQLFNLAKELEDDD